MVEGVGSDGVVSVQIHPISKETYVFTLGQDFNIRVWSCQVSKLSSLLHNFICLLLRENICEFNPIKVLLLKFSNIDLRLNSVSRSRILLTMFQMILIFKVFQVCTSLLFTSSTN